MTTKTNGHGYFRKSKAYGLVCGIALATAFFGAHVSADEVTATQNPTTPQSVTTSVEVETPSTDTTSPATGDIVETPKEDTTSSDVTGSTDEVVETPKQETNLQLPEATTPEQEKINQTVEDTKDILDDAGVKVEVNGENHYTDSNQAQADADKQKADAEKFAETQKAIDEAIKQAQELAQKAGLTVTLKPTTVTSIDEAKAKLAEVQKLIEEATNKLIADKKAETEANKLIEEAKKKAEEAGVVITTTEKQHYDKKEDATADAESQKNKLEAFAKMQQSIDEAIKQAQELAQKAGLTVNVSTVKVTSIEEAKAKLAEVQKLIDEATNKLIADKKAETEANKLIEEAKKKAESAGVIITTTEKQHYDKAEDATADAEAQKQKLNEIINTQNSVNKQLQDLMASLNAVTQTITGNKVTVSSIEEANKKLAEIKAKIQEIDKKNSELKAKYDAEVKKVNEHNAQLKADYEKKLAQYEAAKAEYDKNLAKYMAEMEANKNKDGYLTKPSVQKLIFQSEPQANHTVNKQPATEQEIQEITAGMRPETVEVLKNTAGGGLYVLQKGQSVTVTYTNILNSSVNGKHIKKVVFTYTLIDSAYGDRLLATFDNDPTKTLHYLNGDKYFKLNMDVKFYDEDGNLIDPTGSLVSFSSLNASSPNNGDWEGVSDFSGTMIPIAGSSIQAQPDGTYRASTSNSWVSDGSKIDVSDWDVEGSPLEYYGAIAGRAEGNINFNILSEGRGYVWFAFNSNVKAHTITPPTSPEVPNYKKDPTTPPDYQKVDVPTIQIKTDIHEVGVNKTTSMDVQTPQLETTVHEVGVNKTTEMEVETPQLETDVHEVGINKTTEMEVETPQLKMNMHTVAYDKPATPEAPQVVKSSVLPMTGDETSTASILASIAGVFMTLVGLVGVRKRKEN